MHRQSLGAKLVPCHAQGESSSFAGSEQATRGHRRESEELWNG